MEGRQPKRRKDKYNPYEIYEKDGKFYVSFRNGEKEYKNLEIGKSVYEAFNTFELKSLDLPDIHFHQLRNTYATILLKNSFNSKGVSHLLGHAKEIISVDVYGDTQEIIEDCLDVLEPFIEEVIPKERKDQYYDYSEVIEIDLILEEYFNAA